MTLLYCLILIIAQWHGGMRENSQMVITMHTQNHMMDVLSKIALTINVHVYTNTIPRKHTPERINAQTRTHAYTHVHTRAHTHTRARTHTHTHAYVHTQQYVRALNHNYQLSYDIISTQLSSFVYHQYENTIVQ